ncbi:hypothetical protein ABZW30_11360 [Kitasatospora sp. NPDC004669]|uniref:hypothetical protein n=1 Tax=Kitasatospora sp. NPDC004669 TaxID=3154555 RepID=UPI0033A0FA57
MNRFACTTGRPTAAARGEWWTVPQNATAVYLVLLLPAGVLRGLPEMMTDSCYGPGPCPATHARPALADHSLLALACLTALQWPVAYLLPRARPAAAMLPMPALVVAMFGIEAGT